VHYFIFKWTWTASTAVSPNSQLIAKLRLVFDCPVSLSRVLELRDSWHTLFFS